MEHFKECKVGGKTYTINQFLARKGTRLGTQLIRTLGVPMAALFSKGKDGLKDALPFFMESLASRMDENEVEALVLELLSSTTYNNEVVGGTIDNPGIFDLHFQGRLGSMFKLLTEVVRYNYEDFFSVAIAAGQMELAKTKGPASSRQASNG